MMSAMYPYFLVVHLCCAIIFLGFIFTDVVLLSLVRKKLGDEFADRMFSVISARGTKIMPLCLLLLVLTGGAMFGFYFNSDVGYFATNLQRLLLLKIVLALLIVIMVIISLSCKFLHKPNPVGKIIHPVALCLGFLIVVLAKFAFYGW